MFLGTAIDWILGVFTDKMSNLGSMGARQKMVVISPLKRWAMAPHVAPIAMQTCASCGAVSHTWRMSASRTRMKCKIVWLATLH